MSRRKFLPPAALGRALGRLVPFRRSSTARLCQHVAARPWMGLEPLEGRVLLSAQMSITGGPGVSTAIVNGDSTPSLADHTDLGNVVISTASNPSTSFNFRITNSGDASLSLSSSSSWISGANAGDFSIQGLSSTTVAAGATADFSIAFNPSAVGLRQAIVAIGTNDPSDLIYSFNLQGTGIPDRLSGSTEDQDFTISYSTLNAATHEGGLPPTPTYRIESVQSGTLTKNGTPVVEQSTLFSSGESLVWHPDANANRTQNAFTIKEWNGAQTVGQAIPIRVEVTPVDDAPTGAISNTVIRADGTASVLNLLNFIHDPDVTGTVVHFDTVLGGFDVSLFDTRTPATVANFLSYVNASLYNNTIIHRSIPGFVEQGGGYLPQYPPAHITSHAPVVNEFGVSSLRGTISMAKLGNDPDSATSEYFLNLADNSANLDNQNGGFTTYGEIVGNGMSVVDAMAAVTIYSDSGTFSNVPLRNYTGGALTAANFVLINSIATKSPLTFSITGNTNSALVSAAISGGNLTLASVTGQAGSADITIRATDLTGNTFDTTFTARVNAKPTASNDSASTRRNQAVDISVLANDSDPDQGDTLANNTVAASTPAHGTVNVNATTGVVTYTPANGFSGDDSFTYTVKDNHGDTSNTATVNVHVNHPPTTVADSTSTRLNHAVDINVLTNDTDAEGNGTIDATSVVAATPAHGTVSVNATTGVVTYTPNNGYSGNDSFTYTVADTLGDVSAPATVTLHVNSPPTANNDSVSTPPSQAVVISELANDTDTDTAVDSNNKIDPTTVAIVTGPSHGTANVNATTGAITYTPTDGYLGPDSITYTVNDTLGDTSNVATVALTVEPFHVSLGDGVAAKRVVFTDGTHQTLATVMLKTGTAELEFAGQNLQQSAPTTAGVVTVTGTGVHLVDVTMAQTTNLSTLTFTGQGGDGWIDVSQITSSGALKALSGRMVNLTSKLDIAGSLASLMLHDVSDATMAVGASDPLAKLTARFNNVVRSTLQAALPINSLTAMEFDGVGSAISGTTLGRATINGNFGGDLTLTGPATPTPGLATLGGFRATGQILDGTWTITGDAKPISAASTAAGWTAAISGAAGAIKLTGDAAGSLAAQSLASLTAGGNLAGLDLNLSGAILPGAATLGTLRATGQIVGGDWTINGNARTITASAINNAWNATFTNGGIGTLRTTGGDLSGSLTAMSLNSLSAAGNVANLSLHLTGAALAGAATLGSLRTANQIQAGAWTIAGDVKSISAGSISGNWSAAVGGNVATLRVTTDATGTLSANAIKSLTVGGSLHDATIHVTQPAGDPLTTPLALGSLTVRGLMDTVDLRSEGNVGTVTAGAIHDSNIFAGVRSDMGDLLPSLSSDLPIQAIIKSVRALGLLSEPFAMVDSRIAAWTLGSVSAQYAQAAPENGLAAHTITLLTYKDATGTQKLATPAAFVGLANVGDLLINLV